MKNLFSRNNPIYLITDRSIAGLTHSQIVKNAISAGVQTVKFIMNDYIDIAMAVSADGVHLGQDDMPIEEARRVTGNKMIIGISTHNLNQAIKAQEHGADYIGFGPVFQTSTKDAGKSKGLMSLKNICSKIRIPVVAIGGISSENINDVMNAGAEACAIISAIQSGNIKANIKILMRVL